MIQLLRPLAGTPNVTQAFGNVYSAEPMGYLYPDGSIAYTDGPGAVLNHFHNGVDYGVPCGTPVLAAAAGVVTFAGWDTTGFGECLRVDHGGITTLYAHLNEFGVSKGQHVVQGQPIAISGTTGNSSGCHLHWSVIRDSDGHYVSPVPYMTPAPVSSPPAPPGIQAYAVPFFVETMAPCTLFDGPWDRLHALHNLGKGTRLQCDACTHGQSSRDLATGEIDSRWYHVSSGGWVKSARVNGNAPGSTP